MKRLAILFLLCGCGEGPFITPPAQRYGMQTAQPPEASKPPMRIYARGSVTLPAAGGIPYVDPQGNLGLAPVQYPSGPVPTMNVEVRP